MCPILNAYRVPDRSKLGNKNSLKHGLNNKITHDGINLRFNFIKFPSIIIPCASSRFSKIQPSAAMHFVARL